MSRRLKVLTAAGLALALVLPLTGCGAFVRRVERPVERDSQRIPLQSVTSMQAELVMGAGEMRVEGGASGALDAEFTYTRPEWKPQVDYAVLGDEGRLEVRQREDGRGINFGAQRNDWEIALPNDVPLDLTVRLGAGESNLRLGSLKLQKLEARLGAGDTSIDLRGLKEDLAADIEGGVGQLTLTVPSDVGVRIVRDGRGVGDFDARGFREDAGSLVNDAYDSAKQRIELRIRHGVGDVDVISAD